MAEWKYNAFISYSHSADLALAPAIQSGLHRMARPWYRMRALRVFRDEVALPASADLWQAIADALSQAEWFLLMASPKAAESHYVQKEILWWLQHRPVAKLLILLTDGDMFWDHAQGDFDWSRTTALPRFMGGHFTGEPLFLDLRPFRGLTDLDLRHTRFRSAVLDIAAPLHAIDKDQLDGVDVRRHRAVIQLGWAVTACIAGLGMAAYHQRNQAVRSQIEALSESSQNALQANKTLDATLAALAAAGHVGDMQTGLSGLYWRTFDATNWETTSWRARAGLHRVLATAVEQNQLLGHADRIESLATASSCAEGETWVVSGGRDRTVRVWKSNGEAVHTLDFPSPVRSVAISPDCRTMGAVGGSAVRLWNANGTILATVPLPVPATAIRFGIKKQEVLTGDEQGGVHVWRMDGTPVTSFKAHKARITAMSSAVCQDGTDWLATASAAEDEPVRIWADGRAVARLPSDRRDADGRRGRINGLAFNADCSRLATASQDGVARLWSLGKRISLAAFQHPGPVTGVSFSPDGRTLATSSEPDSSNAPGNDHAVRLWREDGVQQVLRGHTGAVTAVVFLADGRRLYSASADNSIRAWALEPPPITHAISIQRDPQGAAIAPNGQRLVAFSVNGKVAWLNWPSGERGEIDMGQSLSGEAAFGIDDEAYLLRSDGRQVLPVDPIRAAAIPLPSVPIQAFALVPDRSLLATADQGLIRVGNRNGDLLAETSGYAASNPTLAMSPNGRAIAFLATEQQTNQVRLWTWSADVVIDLPSQDAAINALGFSPDGKWLATAGEDHRVRLWDLSGNLRSELLGHTEAATLLAFHPDGRLLATAGYDDSVRVWALDGTELLALRPATANVQALGWHRDELMAVTQDGTAAMWDLDLDRLVLAGCRWLGDYLTTHPRLDPERQQICASISPAMRD